MVSNNPKQNNRTPKGNASPYKKSERVGRSKRLSTLMPKLLGPVMQARGMTISRIITDWPRLAGTAKGWSEPHSLKFPPGKTTDGSLQVNVASGRGPEMQMMTQDIITRINQLFGYHAISRIAISQTAMHAKKRQNHKRSAVNGGEHEKTAFQNARRTITTKASPELQKALDNLGKSLAED